MYSTFARWTALPGTIVLVAAAILAQGSTGDRQEDPARQDDTASAIQMQLAALAAQQQELKAQLDRVRAENETIAAQQYERDITPDSFEEMASKLPGQRIELMIDLAGLDARREVLLEAREHPEENPEYQKLIQLLQRQVELLQENLDDTSLLHERGGTSRGELREAEHRALQAEIELLTVLTSRNDGGPEASHELRQVSLERADRAARLNMVESLMQQCREMRNDWQRLTRLREQEAMLQTRLNMIEAQILEIRSALGTRVPEEPDDDDR